MAGSGDQHTQGPYQEQQYAGDRATEVHRTQQRMPDEDRSTRTEIESSIATYQAELLAPAVRMGDDRAIGAPPNWESMTSTQLYAAAIQANDPDTAENLGRAFNAGGNKLADAANRLLDAVGKLDAAWSGVAADSAKGALTPLAASTGAAGTAAQLTGAQMSRQAAAASEVRKLPPPKEFDAQAELTNALANPNPIAGLADMKAKADEAKAVKQEQVAYLNAYTQAMTSVDGATPSFIEPTTGIAGGDGRRASITGGSVDYAGPIGGTGRIGGDPEQRTSTGTPHAPGTGAFAPGMGFAPDGSDQTGGQEVTPLPGFTPGGGTGSSGFTPTAPGPVGPSGGGPAGAPAAPAAGAGGFGGAFGSFGPGGPGQAGRGGSAPGSTPGAGARPGGGVPGVVAGEPAGAAGRGAAAAGRPGAGMGMGAGGAGSRKEEDTEHERPAYLVEGDPEGTFGSNEMTAPPVIGED
jgi:hypothetical protein